MSKGGSLDAALGSVSSDGVDVELGGGLNFTGGLRADFNPASKVIDVTPSAPLGGGGGGGLGSDKRLVGLIIGPSNAFAFTSNRGGLNPFPNNGPDTFEISNNNYAGVDVPFTFDAELGTITYTGSDGLLVEITLQVSLDPGGSQNYELGLGTSGSDPSRIYQNVGLAGTASYAVTMHTASRRQLVSGEVIQALLNGGVTYGLTDTVRSFQLYISW